MNYRIVEKEAFTVLEKVENHAVITDKNKYEEKVENHAVITDKNKYEISDFWDRVKKDGTVQTLVNALADGKKNLMGICYNDFNNSSESFSYSIAAVCDENCTVPDGYRINCIPERTWAIFECKGAMPGAIQELWHKIVTEFFPTKDYEPTYEMDIEDYPDGDATSVDYTCWLWIPVRKK
ncbi:MAG: GyrI-like domain-containing protein [Oscillospiraceae bacterium]|nr:GyrI-like domain-containing protein [Oscillospiraceae bacterium]